MHLLIRRILPFVLVSFVISFILTPLVKRIGFETGVYARENNRTVHHGKIVRIGGLSIFLAFIITMAIFFDADKTIDGILIGGLIIFLGGLIDDIYDLKPIVKLLIQIFAAIYVITAGDVRLASFNISFFNFDLDALSILITLVWIVGVSNAMNLIDGLDGLCCGISVIVISAIGLIAYFMHRIDIATISLILVGSTLGILPFNFHPASIFIGDSGALFLGYMIACLSLLGFKTTTFITLSFPIVILFVPLADTSLAIIRRKLNNQKVSEADKSHLHHVIMYKLGMSHRNTVLLLYVVTLLFGGCAVITYLNYKLGYFIFAILCFLAWIFIELTGMINKDFHPIIGLVRRLTGHPIKTKDAKFEANKLKD